MKCKCGCEEGVATGKRYKRGHNNRGRKYPKELYPNYGGRGNTAWNKNLTKETDERIMKYSKPRKPKVKVICKGCGVVKFLVPWKARMFNYCSRECYFEHTTIWSKGLTKFTDERIASTAKKSTKEYNPERVEKIKKFWEENKEQRIKAILKGLMKRPTGFEQLIINVCKNCNLPYKYVGDGQVIIAYVNPDFIQSNGKKKLIEVYHDYFKIRDFGSCNYYENQRRKRFAKFGFDVLFLRTEDIEKGEKWLAKKIKEFDEK